MLKYEIKKKIKENEGLDIKIKEINDKIIFDSRTFCRLYYKKGDFDLINDIKKKHFKNLDKYSKYEEIQKLILIVDFVFLLSLKEIMNIYFNNKNLIITAATNNFFKLLFNEAKNSGKRKFILNENILGCKLLNLNEVTDMNNFISYYFEIKENIDINNINKIKNYPLYNCLTNRNDFYLDIRETNTKNPIFDNAIFLVIDPVYEYEHLSLDSYKQSYKYIILLYKTYFFDVNQNIYDILSNYFFPNDDFDSISIPIEGENIENIIETNTKILCRFKKLNFLFILNKEKKVIEIKFNVKNINSDVNFIIDISSKCDKNIQCLIDSIPFNKKVEIKILIEESYNILYYYLKQIYKYAGFTLLNNIDDEKINYIKDKISTSDKNEIAKTSLFSYITQNDKQQFDLIILENTFNADNLLYDGEKLKSIQNHLNKNGLLIIHLIVDNIYLKKSIYKNLNKIFKKVEIINKDALYGLNNMVLCSDN